MNQRITQLAEQCRFEIQGINCEVLGQGFDEEKFAELIVRECARSIEKTIETNCDTDSEKMGCEFAITDLLKHFGVER
jgi:hypothetical protein